MSISLDRLSKRFGNLPVVDQVSLEIAEGELFVLLGPSGSGKSTILRLIAGLTSADGGTILLHGRDVGGLAPQDRGTGFVFQNYAIFRHMTVAKNVEFGLRIRKVPVAERAKKREELLELVGLVGLGNRFAHELSGGQLQRVALARALAYSPGVLLLDEPFGALDAKIRAQLRRHLRAIQKQLSVTTMLVTHDQDEAFDLGDRIGVFDRGHLLEEGRPEALYLRPKSLFVATFLGAGTVLAGRAENNMANLGDFALPIPPQIPHETGSRVRALFRPENVSLASDATRVEGTLIGEGTIVEESFAGSSRRVRLRLPRKSAVRQVAPPVPFGEEGLLVDALVPADFPDRGPSLWLGLRSWQILQRPAPKVLVVTSESDPPESLSAAAELTATLGGIATVLVVTEQAETVDALRKSLKARTELAGLSSSEAKVRAGRFVEQIVAEQVESLYDLLVIDPYPGGRKHPVRSRATLARLLQASITPVLVMIGTWATPSRIVACTAVGEPGKTVIRVAGWLARGLGAPVTLLHVAREAADPGAFTQIHLERGVATLRSFEVQAETRIRAARLPAEGILAEVRESQAGLIAIGGHGPRSRSIFGRDDVMMQILAAADRPVLVVPVFAW
jgi:sulfate/thiosulfate transport system ATP-binding protein